MKMTRKLFLRCSGLSLFALAGKKVIRAFGGGADTPPTAPADGATRWAMVIDTAKCLQEKGCTKCIDACNRAHNIPIFRERQHSIRWIWKEPFRRAFPMQSGDYTEAKLSGKPMVLLCNHCADPPCARVCPTQATWKRPDGIVMMDWHRCIGCRYCMAACPYGSRSFNWLDPRPEIPVLNPDFPTRTKGVVEKCTFCAERIDKGQLPACVEACPEKAMVFGNLADPESQVRQLLQTRYAIQRKPELGTHPSIFYII